jgi:hypothetical protein
MVTSSKILTVTYGTFSCRLEGFDDPFTTLQKVAEYFRKLAAQDRQFGGVPQVPDTNTLMQIANESNPSGVDAEVEAGGIVLRQKPGDAPAEPAMPAPVATFEHVRAETSEDSAEPTEAAVTGLFRSRRQVQPAPRIAPEVATPRAAPGKKSVAETLAAIRRNVESAGTEIEIASDDSDDEVEGDDVAPAAVFAEDAAPAVQDEPVEVIAEAPAATTLDDEDEDEAVEEDQPLVLGDLDRTRVDVADDDAEDEADDDMVLAAEIAAEMDEPVAEDEDDEEDKPVAEAEIAAPVAPDDSDEDDAADLARADAAPTAGEDDGTFDDDFFREAAEDTAPRKSSLTPEQEEELARDLAAAMEASDDDQPEVEDEATARRRERRARVEALRASEGFASGADAVDRLMKTTQHKMDRPEQQRRLRAYDQLKAAVAATEAEAHYRKPDHVDPDEVAAAADLAAYREDLRRAQDRARAADRPAAAPARPAAAAAPAARQAPPLILVSEQRIDAPDARPARDDDHREVAETRGNLALKRAPMEETAEAAPLPDETAFEGIPADAFSDSANFAEFAERVGADEMHDLLEAAAAYTSIVEGKGRFSRAQVMSKLARLETADGFSKEAGLRAFGKLLREGKILRVQDGQFAISKSSRFSVASRDSD